MKKLIYSTILVFLFLGCEKEVQVLTSFPFEISTDYQEEAILNVATPLSVDITPEQVVTTNEYLFSYRTLSGEAYIELENGNRLEEEETTALTNLSLESMITTESLGDIEIEVTIDDQQGIIETIILRIASENNPFEVEITAVRSDVTVNAESTFSVTLTNTGDDKTIAYDAKYFVSQGQGEIRKVIDDEFSQIELGESFSLEEGTTNYIAIFTGDGENIVTVEVTDSNGQTITKMFSFNVEVIDFNFNATPVRNETNLNVDVPISFLISEVDGGNDDYKLRYVIENGNADVFNNSTQLFAGSNLSVPLSEEFSLTFRPTETGEVSIRFFVKNESGVEKNEVVNISVSDRNFDYTVNRSLASLPIGEPLTLNYAITEEGGASVDTYSLVFGSSANGTLTVNSVVYNAGQTIVVPSLAFQAIYTPLNDGDHRVTSTITAQSNNLSVEKEISVTVLPSDFEFTVSSPLEVSVGETIDLEFTLNELVGNSTFDASYFINGVDAEFRNENGVLLAIDTDYDVDNTFKWTLTGVQQGTMNITFEVKNQFGVRKTQPVTIEVVPIDFDFEVNLLDNVIALENPIRLRFTMTAPDVLDYDLSFTANTGGLIQVGFMDVEVGNSLPIGSTSFDADYRPGVAGNAILNITITASNGITKTKTLNFNITQKPIVTTVQDFSGTCGMTRVPRQGFRINWIKDPGEAIVSARIRVFGRTNKTVNTTFPTPINGNSATISIGCTNPPDRIEVTIIDSRGQQSDVFRVNY